MTKTIQRWLRFTIKPIIIYLFDKYCHKGEHSAPYRKAFMDGQRYGEERTQAQLNVMKMQYEAKIEMLKKEG